MCCVQLVLLSSSTLAPFVHPLWPDPLARSIDRLWQRAEAPSISHAQLIKISDRSGAMSASAEITTADECAGATMVEGGVIFADDGDNRDRPVEGAEEGIPLDDKSPLDDGPRRPRCRRCRACCKCPRSLALVIHFCLLATAVLCIVPSGVLVSVMRARLGGVATLVWLVYCCVEVVVNAASLLRRGPRREEAARAGDETRCINCDEERVASCCGDMGCLCVGSASSSSAKQPWRLPLAVALLLVVEGVLLLVPVFAQNAANVEGAIDEVFPGASSLAPSPRASPFSFGQYLLPGSFSFYGGYDNNAGGAITFRYKNGCAPECALDVHTPQGEAPPSGYPVM